MGKQFGLRCSPLEDGSQVCKRYKRQNGEKLATGTDAHLTIDPSTCKARATGDINDEDAEILEVELKKMENVCRRGF